MRQSAIGAFGDESGGGGGGGSGKDEEVRACGAAMVFAFLHVLRRGGCSSFLEDGLLAIRSPVCR